MPELIEVELYRRLAAEVVGSEIVDVETPDPSYLRGPRGSEVRTAVLGTAVVAARRIGKLLLLDTPGGTLGVRFGMTGRLVLGDRGPIDALEYGPARDDRRWDRFVLVLSDGGRLRVNDPRRFGGVELDVDESVLGPDALAVTLGGLRGALAGSRAPLKARLLDQRRLAGLGNLLVDEVLWRADLDPARSAGSLDDAELRRLHRRIRSTVPALLEAGGSHLGDLQSARRRGGTCPADGTLLARRTVGGRTTYSCPWHQR